jgi:hypothetical protein
LRHPLATFSTANREFKSGVNSPALKLGTKK